MRYMPSTLEDAGHRPAFGFPSITVTVRVTGQRQAVQNASGPSQKGGRLVKSFPGQLLYGLFSLGIPSESEISPGQQRA